MVIYLDFEDSFRDLHVIAIVGEDAMKRYAVSSAWEDLHHAERKVKENLRRAIQDLLHDGDEVVSLALTIVQEDDLLERDQVGLNNCFFKTETTITHDRLRFRSRAEIAVYTELCQRQLLFFPNPAAIFGGHARLQREPDFLLCCKGKWGILEVMGDPYHKNAAKDHDRARFFKEVGVLCIEFFTAEMCAVNPRGVVDRFLAILEQY
ncbi:MAG TPA: hypothetical protein VH643_37620 [Gemmataceae bacterium]|jgi:very-short-patch-repair endonuclease